MSPKTVYLRTEAGRIEIHEKKSGLTQSERLVLIMIDGVASCEQVQHKLSSLTAERFTRALKILLKKELIGEVFLQVENQAAEEIEQSVVDRYLHQDPLDPVTIISFSPEDEFDDGVHEKTAAVIPAHSVPELDQIVATPAIDVAHAKLADELHDELAARNMEWKRKQAAQNAASAESQYRPLEVKAAESTVAAPKSERRLDAPEPTTPNAMKPPLPSQSDSASSLLSKRPTWISRVTTLHWGYWMIAIGSAFILSFLIMQLIKQ